MNELEELMPATTTLGLFKELAKIAAWVIVFYVAFIFVYGAYTNSIRSEIFLRTWETALVAYICLCVVFCTLYFVRKRGI